MEERSTIIWYDLKERFKLSLSEYVVLDLVYRLCGSHSKRTGKTPFPCQVPKASLAEYLGMSKVGVFRIVERLVKKGVLRKGKGAHQSYLIPAEKWEDAVFQAEAHRGEEWLAVEK